MKYNIEVVLIASEVIPFSKTGGLADVAGSLPKALAQIGVKVTVFSPFYLSTKSQFKTQRSKKRAELIIKVGERMKTGQVYHSRQASVDFYFIANKEYFEREFLYGSEKGDYPDNGQRFIFFSKAVLESMTELNIKPDIIHCHDWQTALVPLYLKTIYSHNFSQAKTVFTIHNLGYQGMFSQDTFYDIGVAQRFFTPDTLEFYGKVNFLKAGLLYADLLTTVSPTYAKEIQTKEFGFGLDKVLSLRSND
ncbi:MAG: glycogen/starch synthase, partial [candidate division WOR-3 bacterium]|nr:glycogen/starch synthase [candidate division WOR-3 bacterium]